MVETYSVPGAYSMATGERLPPETYTRESLGHAPIVQGHPTPGRYVLAPELVEALKGAGWIYEVNPETTYLTIGNGVLWAKYQQIIGGRPLVEIQQ